MILFLIIVWKKKTRNLRRALALLWNESSVFIQTCAQSIQNLLRKLKYKYALMFWGSFAILLYHREIILLLKYMTVSFSLTCLHWFIIIYVTFLSFLFFFSLGYLLLLMGMPISYLSLHLSDYNLRSFENDCFVIYLVLNLALKMLSFLGGGSG